MKLSFNIKISLKNWIISKNIFNNALKNLIKNYRELF